MILPIQIAVTKTGIAKNVISYGLLTPGLWLLKNYDTQNGYVPKS
jgi:hypothetical protein